jgi:hypothetical protein
MGKTKMCGNGESMGILWFIGWLFTIGFLKLAFWKGVLALILWPYYIGAAIHAPVGFGR